MDNSNFKPTPLSALIGKLSEAKYDTALVTDAVIDTIEETLNGEAYLVDPTNPAVMCLEMASALSVGNTQEAIHNLRRQYPALAETWEDLYLHMSDNDFLDRFDQPGRSPFYFAFQLNELRANSVYDSVEGVRKVIIARETRIQVDSVDFTLLYPIVIRLFPNGVIQATYDVTQPDPLQPLDKNIIKVEPRGENWVFLQAELLQLGISTTMHSIGKTYNFRKRIPFNNRFHYARVYFKNESTDNEWRQMVTTHTDQVFRASVPTASLKVLGQELEVSIPVIYTTSGQVSGDVRVDIYTTRGDEVFNLANYTEDKFLLRMEPTDPAKDSNEYTFAATQVSLRVFSTAISTGGRAGLSFRELRERVINNSVGEKKLPITESQLDAMVEDEGFEIVRNIDTLTNLVFLATRRLPAPSNPKLITSANIGMVTYQFLPGSLEGHSKIVRNLERTTIRSKALWRNDNGVISLVTDTELAEIGLLGDSALMNRVNSSQYLYTPFYYVVDTTNKETDLRSYALDQPKVSNLRFMRHNQTLQLQVNTDNFALTKQEHGYDLRIQTASGEYYRNLPSSQVGVQLAFYPRGETRLVYINGVQEKRLDSGEYIYLFRIETNHDLDKNDLICITNAEAEGVTDYRAWVELFTEVHLLHHTTSIVPSYQPDDTDQLLGKWLLPDGSVGLVHEKLDVKLGSALSNLWRRARSHYLDTVYVRHTVDVPAIWEEDVFVSDEKGSNVSIVNGEVVYNYLHRKGDPVLDEHGEPIYKYRVGDVVLDEQGNPVIETGYSRLHEIDLLVVDGKYHFSNDTVTIAYRYEVEAILESWITELIPKIKSRVIGNSRVYFYPKTTLGTILVETENNSEDYTTSEQSFVVDLYVGYSILNNPAIKERLKATTIRVLDAFISQPVVNMSTARDQLKRVYGSSVNALTIRGLGGARDYQVLRVRDDQNKLCLKKVLERQADRTFIVRDAVEVNFKLFE